METEWPRSECRYRAGPSLLASVPETEFFHRQRLEELLGENESGRLQSAETLFRNRMNGLDPRYRRLGPSRRDGDRFAPLGLLDQVGEVRLCFEHAGCDHGCLILPTYLS